MCLVTPQDSCSRYYLPKILGDMRFTPWACRPYERRAQREPVGGCGNEDPGLPVQVTERLCWPGLLESRSVTSTFHPGPEHRVPSEV